MTSAFGQRFHPVLRVWKLHDGTDFGVGCGTPIRAPYAGTVRAYYNAGYGHRLFLSHGPVDGRRVETAFNHATHYIVGRPAGPTRSGDRVRRQYRLRPAVTYLMVWLDGRLVDPMIWF